MRVIKPPHRPIHYPQTKFAIFLGGSIEMGAAENWQSKLEEALSSYDDDLVLYNPRRDDWDSSWPQDPTPGTNFHEQVVWELDHQESSDLDVYYFDPNTKSPITLMELGAYGMAIPRSTIVCCPPSFYRYGNVKVFCDYYDITLVETLTDFIEQIKIRLDKVYYGVNR